MTDQVSVTGWRGDVEPGRQIPGRDASQDCVHEAGRALADSVLHQVHRRRHRGMRLHPGGKQLVSAEPEHLAHRRIQRG